MAGAIRVAIVEDQKAVRDGLATLIGTTPGFEAVARFASMEQALEKLPDSLPHVLLADIKLPGMSGVAGVRQIRDRFPAVQVLMLTVFADDDHVFEALCAGACGYLLKETPPAKLIEALREVHGGGAPMSPEVARKVVTIFQKIAPPPYPDCQLSARELDILRLLAEGHSYKTCASRLFVSLDTVRFHVRNIYERLHVHSKSEAVMKALRRGIIY